MTLKVNYLLKIFLEDDDSIYHHFLKTSEIPFLPQKGLVIYVEDENLTVDYVAWNDSCKLLTCDFVDWGIDDHDEKYLEQLKNDFIEQGWELLPATCPEYEPVD